MKKNCLFLLLIFVTPFILFSCKKSDDTTTLVGNWTYISDFVGTPRSGAVTFTIGDTVYVGLGYNSTVTGDVSKYLRDFYKYDYKKNQWTQIDSIPAEAGGRSDALAFSVNNRGYVGTGWDGDNRLNDFWEYNPTGNPHWRRVKELSTRLQNGVAFTLGSNGYVGTGLNSNGAKIGNFWKFNPPTSDIDPGSWVQIENIPFIRENAVAFVMNNKAYVVTGDNNGQYLNSFFSYDPDNGWVKLREISNVSSDTYDDSYNIIRSNAVAVVANGKAYLTCGATSGVRSDTWEYDPTSDTWVQKTPFEGSARSKAIGFSINNQIFVTAGSNGGNGYFGDMWEFHPTATYDVNN